MKLILCLLFVLVVGFPVVVTETHNAKAFVGKGNGRILQTEKADSSAAVLVVPIEGSDVKQAAEIRTATGGWINTIMILLTLVAFCGNLLFLCYVFWLSK